MGNFLVVTKFGDFDKYLVTLGVDGPLRNLFFYGFRKDLVTLGLDGPLERYSSMDFLF